jgi:hypothetical protein
MVACCVHSETALRGHRPGVEPSDLPHGGAEGQHRMDRRASLSHPGACEAGVDRLCGGVLSHPGTDRPACTLSGQSMPLIEARAHLGRNQPSEEARRVREA